MLYIRRRPDVVGVEFDGGQVVLGGQLLLEPVEVLEGVGDGHVVEFKDSRLLPIFCGKIRVKIFVCF